MTSPPHLAAQRPAARAAADAIAELLASPAEAERLQLAQGWHPQSLAVGAAGVALLHVERACAGLAPWSIAHDWLVCATLGAVHAGNGSHLHYGAPAVAFALHGAASSQPRRYSRALSCLDRQVAITTRRRLDTAHDRIDRGRLPALAEFDAIRGLAGIGTHLLRREPDGALIRDVLAYLVRLTEPIERDGSLLPGWWADSGPSGRPSPDHPGGHANNGVAHGIGGPLALLSLALRRGITVEGHTDAIARICAWLDRWRRPTDTGAWWPYWITRRQLHAGRLDQAEPARPSWCYGTAGLARAQQLAGLATDDTERRRAAEAALAAALSDTRQLAAIDDTSLCHGYAGLLHIARCAAAEALTPAVANCVPRLLDTLTRFHSPYAMATPLRSPVSDIGLLEGAAGVALALHAAAGEVPPASRWDAALLIA